MVKKIIIILLCSITCSCFAQIDSLVINVRGVDIVMVKIEGGTYKRGCNPQAIPRDSCCFSQNRGVNTVSVKSFYLAKFEVTQKLYQQIAGKNPSWFKTDSQIGPSDNRPVESVTWYEAQTFIDSLNIITGMHFRLPTEAEWEYAARGGSNLDSSYYAGSNNLNDVTWCSMDINRSVIPHCWTFPVGGKMPNSLEIYDMTGNVSEWCSDWYSDSYYQTQSKFDNPQGPKEGDKKVIRGGDGSRTSTPTMDVRYRKGADPTKRDMHIGFRLAMDAK